MISLRLFGGASLEDGDGVLTGPAAQRHRLALLALLASAHPRGLARDRLTAYLWPDRDDAHSRNLLNQAVYALRRALGEDAIVSAGEELRVNGETLRCDLIEFETSLAAGDLIHAAEVYSGPLLDGFSLPDAPEFEQWADGERERVRRGFCRALETLAQDAGVRHEPAEAAEWWRRLAAQEPYNAHITLRLMEALDAAGDRAGAIQQARLHSLLIKQEFDAEPDPQVVMLAERLRSGPIGTAGAATSTDATTATAAGTADGRAVSDAPAAAASTTAPPITAGAVVEHDITVRTADRSVARAATGSAAVSRRRVLVAAVVIAVVVAAAWASVNASGSRPAEIRRIAVLPFANLTGDPQQDYFVAGMHDALVAELAQIEGLTVYSRQSVLRYQATDMPLPAIARELGVDALVEGSVFQSGDSVRITVQLMRANPEGHVWAGTHRGRLSHALALQGDVARAIADAMRARVAPEVQARLGRSRAAEPVAQQAYLLGVYHLEHANYGQIMTQQEREAAHFTAIAHLEQAVAQDPQWAAAHARLALAYHWLASSMRGVYEDEYYPKSKAAALRALELDETESQAHASLGFLLYSHEWDWAGADRAIRRALELDPNSHHWVAALFLQAAGRHDEAINHFRMAEERNPLSDGLKLQIANAYACADRFDEAIDHARELHARVAPTGRTRVVGDSIWLLDFVSVALAVKGSHDEAIRILEDAGSLADTAATQVSLALAYALAGRTQEARAIADRLEARAQAAGTIFRPAQLYAALGDTDRALDMVEAAALRSRSARANFRCLLTYRLLRDEPRMQALLRPVRFPK